MRPVFDSYHGKPQMLGKGVLISTSVARTCLSVQIVDVIDGSRKWYPVCCDVKSDHT